MMLSTVIIVLAIGRAADALVLPPDQHQSRPANMRDRSIAYVGGRIEVCIQRTRTSQPRLFVLRFTGGDAPGCAIVTADRWRDHDVEVWVANYPGYGKSSGPRSLATMTRAALATYDELRRLARDRPIALEGFSLGTVPALAVAARRDDVAAVILQNGPPIRELAIEHFGWWNLFTVATIVAAEIPDDLDSIANARASRAPALFLIAERDRSVPPRFQRMIVDAHRAPKQVILQRGADHVAPLSESETRELQAFMSSVVPPPATRPVSR